MTPNYAINPTPELDLRSNRAVLPARVIAALDFLCMFAYGMPGHTTYRQRAAPARAAILDVAGCG